MTTETAGSCTPDTTGVAPDGATNARRTHERCRDKVMSGDVATVCGGAPSSGQIRPCVPVEDKDGNATPGADVTQPLSLRREPRTLTHKRVSFKADDMLVSVREISPRPKSAGHDGISDVTSDSSSSSSSSAASDSDEEEDEGDGDYGDSDEDTEVEQDEVQPAAAAVVGRPLGGDCRVSRMRLQRSVYADQRSAANMVHSGAVRAKPKTSQPKPDPGVQSPRISSRPLSAAPQLNSHRIRLRSSSARADTTSVQSPRSSDSTNGRLTSRSCNAQSAKRQKPKQTKTLPLATSTSRSTKSPTSPRSPVRSAKALISLSTGQLKCGGSPLLPIPGAVIYQEYKTWSGDDEAPPPASTATPRLPASPSPDTHRDCPSPAYIGYTDTTTIEDALGMGTPSGFSSPDMSQRVHAWRAANSASQGSRAHTPSIAPLWEAPPPRWTSS